MVSAFPMSKNNQPGCPSFDANFRYRHLGFVSNLPLEGFKIPSLLSSCPLHTDATGTSLFLMNFQDIRVTYFSSLMASLHSSCYNVSPSPIASLDRNLRKVTHVPSGTYLPNTLITTEKYKILKYTGCLPGPHEIGC